MDRLTSRIENGTYYLDRSLIADGPAGYTGEAVDRLALFETICIQLLHEQAQLSQKLSALRLAGKSHSYHYKEKMAKKLINGNTLSLLRSYGVDI